MALEREVATYEAHLMDLLASQGKYVLIRGDEIAGVFDTYEAALDRGYQEYGPVPFLVKVIQPAEPILHFGRDLPRCQS